MNSDQPSRAQVAHRNPAEQGGFTMYPNVILKAAGLSLGARVLYGLLKMYAWQSDCAFPGQDRIAAEMGVSTRQVRTYQGELEAAGLLTVERRGLTQTNRYWIEVIPADFQSDRKYTSDQERNPTSDQDRKPTSDKEDADQEDTIKNILRALPSADPEWDAIPRKGTPIRQRADAPPVYTILKANDDPIAAEQWARLLATFPHQGGKCNALRPTEQAFMLLEPSERAQVLIAAGHYAQFIANTGSTARALRAFIEDTDYTQWQTPAAPLPSRPNPTRPAAPPSRLLNPVTEARI